MYKEIEYYPDFKIIKVYTIVEKYKQEKALKEKGIRFVTNKEYDKIDQKEYYEIIIYNLWNIGKEF